MMNDEKIISIREMIHGKQGALAHIKSEINERALVVGRLPEGSVLYRPNMDAPARLTSQQAKLEGEVKKLEEKIADPSKIKLAKDEFLNLTKTAGDKMRAGTAVEKRCAMSNFVFERMCR